ncbi:MAG: 2-oxoglutarate dehydrogenase complex dihydrolipoyllysine-residue succinyltransferase [Bdellovibrionaceae bacterium]|nr:2-oxoglutarate dehydrogenase complex dihydrolipoyllysine-residue succinyltransferase [Bdellovibrionales bacterium]MCB9083337.1 2-oxoglutarate dehydrogenase complex dihydrolipoyllysine-residue succinyltransferase [Pseudobdellovibrionaceae bacterium]
MKVEIKVPAVGESITEATIAEWMKKSGEAVKRDDVLLVLETDKASVEVVAEKDGVLEITVKEGETVQVGATVGLIDTAGAATAVDGPPPAPPAEPPPPPPGLGQEARHAGVEFPPPPTGAPSSGGNGKSAHAAPADTPLSPGVRRMVAEHQLDPNQLGQGSGKDGRLTKEDVTLALNRGSTTTSQTPSAPATASAEPQPSKPTAPPPSNPTPVPPLPQPRSGGGGDVRRIAMSKLRQTIARRLVEAQQTAAILTTFNEIDMSAVMDLRARYKDSFKEKYGVSLGFMGFFVKAAVEALKAFPQVNAEIDGTDILFKDYINMGIAVSTEKGLLVPVIRDADQLSVAEIELAIRHYAIKARDGKITLDDLAEGTFTISNGGVFGSLMSTPILNPPQSGILGLHKIEERPIAVEGQVVIRPMMYVALSYDHRIVDGRESVSFLVKIKEGLEDPSRLLLEI